MTKKPIRMHAAGVGSDKGDGASGHGRGFRLHFGIVPDTGDHEAEVAAAKTNKTLCGATHTAAWEFVQLAAKGSERNVIENTAMIYPEDLCGPCASKARAKFPLPAVLDIKEIRFYKANEAVWGAFSNLYRRPIEIDGQVFSSNEFAYQSKKPRDPAVRAWLMAAPTNGLLAKASHQLTRAWEVAPGWSAGKVDWMRRVLHAKFTQHEDLKRLLLCTGNATLIESGTIDDDAGRFWGIVKSTGKGKNTLGVLLMDLREHLRNGPQPAPDWPEPAPDGLPDCVHCEAQLVACSHPYCDEATCPVASCLGYGHQSPSVKHNDSRYLNVKVQTVL